MNHFNQEEAHHTWLILGLGLVVGLLLIRELHRPEAPASAGPPAVATSPAVAPEMLAAFIQMLPEPDWLNPAGRRSAFTDPAPIPFGTSWWVNPIPPSLVTVGVGIRSLAPAEPRHPTLHGTAGSERTLRAGGEVVAP